MGNNARKNVVNNFSWQETVTQTLKAYEDLTKNSKNRE
jgi:glycosyltransferase involved in cell wall biosynthesis